MTFTKLLLYQAALLHAQFLAENTRKNFDVTFVYLQY